MAEAAEHPEKQALQEAVLGSDPLLGALEQIAAHHSLPFSENVAKIGIAPSGPHLALSELEAAARNLKLNARIYERAPSDVPAIVCPYLVFFKNGDVGIVEERTGRRRFKVSVAGAPAQLIRTSGAAWPIPDSAVFGPTLDHCEDL